MGFDGVLTSDRARFGKRESSLAGLGGATRYFDELSASSRGLLRIYMVRFESHATKSTADTVNKRDGRMGNERQVAAVGDLMAIREHGGVTPNTNHVT